MFSNSHASTQRTPRPSGRGHSCFNLGGTGRREIYLGSIDLPGGRRQLSHRTGSLLGLPGDDRVRLAGNGRDFGL